MLTLQFIPYQEIEGLDSDARIRKILNLVKHDKIVLLGGRLKSDEEAELIRRTMEQIDERFHGIELSVIYPESKNQELLKKIRNIFINLLLGDRNGFTIIGPASIIKEIKKDPDKIQLLTQDLSPQKKKKTKKKRRR